MTSAVEIFEANIRAIDSILDGYRTRQADHERFVTKLHALLMEERTDEAMDMVRHEYAGIHGPND